MKSKLLVVDSTYFDVGLLCNRNGVLTLQILVDSGPYLGSYSGVEIVQHEENTLHRSTDPTK